MVVESSVVLRFSGALEYHTLWHSYVLGHDWNRRVHTTSLSTTLVMTIGIVLVQPIHTTRLKCVVTDTFTPTCPHIVYQDREACSSFNEDYIMLSDSVTLRVIPSSCVLIGILTSELHGTHTAAAWCVTGYLIPSREHQDVLLNTHTHTDTLSHCTWAWFMWSIKQHTTTSLA